MSFTHWMRKLKSQGGVRIMRQSATTDRASPGNTSWSGTPRFPAPSLAPKLELGNGGGNGRW